jgi:hypothetical protein
MEIACWSSVVRALIPHGLDARSLIWKLLAADVRPSGWLCLTVRTRLSNWKDFQWKSQKILSHCCPSGRPRFTVRTASVHITAVAHSAPQPINRGPWALRTARIRYWIPQVLREVILRISLSSLSFLWSHCKCAVAALQLKSILGVGSKVKDSIKDPFR